MDSWPVSCSMVLAHVCSLLLPPPLAVDKGHRRQSLPFRTSPSRTHLLAGRRRQAPLTREQQQQHAMGGAGRVGGAATAGGGGLEPPSPTPLHRATTVSSIPPLVPSPSPWLAITTLSHLLSSLISSGNDTYRSLPPPLSPSLSCGALEWLFESGCGFLIATIDMQHLFCSSIVRLQVCALGVCVNACTPPLIPCIFHRELMNTLGRRVSSNNIFSRASGNLIEIVANSDSDGKVSGLRQAGLEGDEYLAVADE